MNSSFAASLGIDPDMFHFIVLPLLIFLARIVDVSINTLRIIYMLHGKKLIAPILGFFEALVWILVISQVFQNLGSPLTYVAYSAGFGMGIFVGMLIEDKLAIGKVVVRIITQKDDAELIQFMNENNFRYSNVSADSENGAVNILFTVIKREDLKETLQAVKLYNPQAFYTVEGVKKVSDDDIANEKGFLFRQKFLGKSS
jgi:uncharacterized protein YebE (UPF0316 family)